MYNRVSGTNAILFIALFILMGCNKSDEKLPKITVSRLYVAITAPTTGSESSKNTLVIDPADVTPFKSREVLSDIFGSQGICLDDSTFMVYQVSALKHGVQKFVVSAQGILTESSLFVDSSLISPRAMAYRNKDKLLFISNNNDSTIKAYYKPDSLTGRKNKAVKRLKLNGLPQGICLDKENLFVVLEGDRKEIQVGKITKANSLIFPISGKITIAGATNLRGIFYYAKQDILLVTDIGSKSDTKDGKIFIIEGATAKFATNGLITPTRVISGAATLLGNPVDVDFDQREDKNIIYVAEEGNKKIIGFKLSDTGDIAPIINQDLSYAPTAIHLDAR